MTRRYRSLAVTSHCCSVTYRMNF